MKIYRRRNLSKPRSLESCRPRYDSHRPYSSAVAGSILSISDRSERQLAIHAAQIGALFKHQMVHPEGFYLGDGNSRTRAVNSSRARRWFHSPSSKPRSDKTLKSMEFACHCWHGLEGDRIHVIQSDQHTSPGRCLRGTACLSLLMSQTSIRLDGQPSSAPTSEHPNS